MGTVIGTAANVRLQKQGNSSPAIPLDGGNVPELSISGLRNSKSVIRQSTGRIITMSWQHFLLSLAPSALTCETYCQSAATNTFTLLQSTKFGTALKV